MTGSMFWRYDVQVYAGKATTDYGVHSFDSTWGIITDHAGVLRERRVATPPRPECKLGCWVPKHRGTLKRGCGPLIPYNVLTELHLFWFVMGSQAADCVGLSILHHQTLDPETTVYCRARCCAAVEQMQFAPAARGRSQ